MKARCLSRSGQRRQRVTVRGLSRVCCQSSSHRSRPSTIAGGTTAHGRAAREHLEDVKCKLADLVALRREFDKLIGLCRHGTISECRIIDVPWIAQRSLTRRLERAPC